MQILAEMLNIILVLPFEVFSEKIEIARGGRYDNLLKSLGAKKNIPAVGVQLT